MTQSRTRAIALLVLTVAFAIAPAFAPSFRGYDPADFPLPVIHPPVQPAGYTFSIWLALYVALILSALIGWRSHASDPEWDRPRLPLIVSVALGCFWLNVANVAPVPATLMILVMAGCAVAALLATRPGGPAWLRQPLAAYAGWVTAASGVATGVVLTGYGVLSAAMAALTVLLAVLIVGLAVLWKARAPIYGAVIAWALAGIVVANLGQVPLVRWAALAGAVIMVVASLIVARRRV